MQYSLYMAATILLYAQLAVQLLQFKYSSRVCPLFLLSELTFHKQLLYAKYLNSSFSTLSLIFIFSFTAIPIIKFAELCNGFLLLLCKVRSLLGWIQSDYSLNICIVINAIHLFDRQPLFESFWYCTNIWSQFLTCR